MTLDWNSPTDANADPASASDGSSGGKPPAPVPISAGAIRFCKSCGDPWDPTWATCPRCDARRGSGVDAAAAQAGLASDVRRVKFAVALYFALLAVSGVTIVVMLASEYEALPVAGDIAASVAMAVITLAWCAGARRDLAPVLTRVGPAWMYAAAAATAVATVALALTVVAALEHVLEVPTIEYLEGFVNEGYGFQWAVLLVCVMPALFEELAFRGVILSALEHVIGAREALIVSALMFAILHLSVPSIPHLFVLGLVLGWMRQRSGSLYPAMLAHFTHNFLVLMIEQNRSLLPW